MQKKYASVKKYISVFKKKEMFLFNKKQTNKKNKTNT